MENPALITKDRGYAWVVAFAMTLAIVFGHGLTIGNLSLYVHVWIHELGITEQEAGWVASIRSLVPLIPGAVYSLVVHTVGVWKCQLVATFLLLAGYLTISFATSLWHLFIGFSLFIGLGSAASLMSTTAIIEDYFDIYKGRIWAISMAALSFGKIVGPALLELLIEHIGYKTALLLHTAIVASSTLLTALIYIGRDAWICCPQKHTEENRFNGEKKTYETEQDDETDSNSSYSSSSCNSSEEESSTDRYATITRQTKLSVKERLKQALKQQRKILINPRFIALIFHYLILSAGEIIWLTYAIEMATQSGYASSQQAAFGPTTNGVTSVITSIIMAAMSKYNKHPLPLSMIFVLLVCSCIVCLPFVTYLPVYFLLMGLFGIGESGFTASIMFNVIQLFEKSEIHVTHMMSYLYLSMGLGFFLGPMAVGDAIRITESVDVAFYIGGAISFLSLFFLFPLWLQTQIPGSGGKTEIDEAI